MLMGGPYPWFLKNATMPTSTIDCNETATIRIDILQTVPYTMDTDPLSGTISCEGVEKESDVADANYGTECIDNP